MSSFLLQLSVAVYNLEVVRFLQVVLQITALLPSDPSALAPSVRTSYASSDGTSPVSVLVFSLACSVAVVTSLGKDQLMKFAESVVLSLCHASRWCLKFWASSGIRHKWPCPLSVPDHSVLSSCASLITTFQMTLCPSGLKFEHVSFQCSFMSHPHVLQ